MNVRQVAGLFAERDGVGELAVEGVVGEIDVAQLGGHLAERAGAAVAAHVAAEVGDLVAVGEDLAIGGLGEVEGDDALRGEGEQFTGLADTVLVEVAPEAQTGEAGVEAVDLAVAVRVFLGERGEAVGGNAAGAQRGAIAEQFAAVVDAAVAVAIEDEEGIVALHPTGGGPDTVAVVVEEDGVAGVDADGF
ncbi:MAG: hypothetical protein AW11_03227 [Candidatus Accumulibacter regalis]|uniref:Uncharacterized protein n=1 Tax=Accumulibacter regalis TaxID=522306 RepID=A0A011NTN9_ACCRE|nr:MAG: hypothetical protein AW11_03227 [Candidatus Accumulibacter regalis]